jgi:hypothetical protein
MRQQIVILPFCSAASMTNRRHLATTTHSLEKLPSAPCASMSIVLACVCCRSVVDPSWTVCLKLAVPNCSQCTRLSAVLCLMYTLLRGIALESTASLPWDGYRHSVGSFCFYKNRSLPSCLHQVAGSLLFQCAGRQHLAMQRVFVAKKFDREVALKLS